jgi:hypothetical protein
MAIYFFKITFFSNIYFFIPQNPHPQQAEPKITSCTLLSVVYTTEENECSEMHGNAFFSRQKSKFSPLHKKQILRTW